MSYPSQTIIPNDTQDPFDNKERKVDFKISFLHSAFVLETFNFMHSDMDHSLM